MGNEVWMKNFPMTEVHYMPKGDYDHCPVLLKSFPSVNRKPFRFLHMWSHSHKFLEVIRSG